MGTGPLLDKDWFACDNGAASPHRGRCYATYTDDAKNWTVVQWSDDGGAHLVGPVNATTTLVGTQPVIRLRRHVSSSSRATTTAPRA